MRERNLALALIGFLALAAASCGGDGGTPASTTPGAPIDAADATIRKDITYCSPGGTAQKLDIISPKENATAPRPLAIYFHGGSWTTGSKQVTNSWFTDVAKALISRGFVVATADYRLATDDVPWTAQVEDARCAVRYLRAHASELGLDPGRFAIWGDSSGAWLAALVALPGATAGFDTAEWANVSSGVQAVVDLWGPVDLTATGVPQEGSRSIRRVFGKDTSVLGRASPMTYISALAPPFLVVHGDQDELVPVAQSEALDAKLDGLGGDSEFVVVEGGKHGLINDEVAPALPELVARIAAFVDRTLTKP